MCQDEVFIYADFSQLELRCAAHLSKDPSFLAAFNKGLDLHEKTAKAFFGKEYKKELHRQVGKRSNFLLIYNGSAQRLKDQLWEDIQFEASFDECNRWRKEFFSSYPRYKEFLDEEKRFALKHFGMLSIFGRVRRLPDLKYNSGINYRAKKYEGAFSDELIVELNKLDATKRFKYFEDGTKKALTIYDLAARKVRHALNQAYNFPIQSMAASIVKRSMLELDRKGFDIVNQVHDAVFVQVDYNNIKESKEVIRNILENTIKIDVPLTVDMKVLNSFDPNDVYEV